MTGELAQQQLKVVYTMDSVEFYAADEGQARDEDLVFSLYHPLLSLFIMSAPETEVVPRKPDYDADFLAEMKGVFPPEAMKYVEFFRDVEGLEIEQNPTRNAGMFPVKLQCMDGEGTFTAPEGHAGLEFLMAKLGGRSTIRVADLRAIAEEWKAR